MRAHFTSLPSEFPLWSEVQIRQIRSVEPGPPQQTFLGWWARHIGPTPVYEAVKAEVPAVVMERWWTPLKRSLVLGKSTSVISNSEVLKGLNRRQLDLFFLVAEDVSASVQNIFKLTGGEEQVWTGRVVAFDSNLWEGPWPGRPRVCTSVLFPGYVRLKKKEKKTNDGKKTQAPSPYSILFSIKTHLQP